MAEKMWAGRFKSESDALADDFNSSISADGRMYRQDIRGSMAHAAMLSATGIIEKSASDNIINGLSDILGDLECGALEIDSSAEDIHMFIESELTKRIGDDGKKLHTARSRNDQVALDIRLYLRDEADEVLSLISSTVASLLFVAKEGKDAIMPGYTHLQRAQPILFAQEILAYAYMLMRDGERIKDAVRRMNLSPLGSCALAGTTYPIDRRMTAEALGFDGIVKNSIDGVSDRDFCVELMSAFSLIMMHLSRLSEEIILWSSWEFKFIELDDAYTTGSSIMPQKKNSDMAELIRGKTGRVYGDLMALLTTLKGIPLAYNKDMQEDKEAVFDALDTVKACLGIAAPMIKSMRLLKENMALAAKKGFINATDLADYLTKKGLPFRSSYKLVGGLVGKCIDEGRVLEDLSLEEFKAEDSRFGSDVYEAISMEECVRRRISEGGTGHSSVEKQIQDIEEYLKKEKGIKA